MDTETELVVPDSTPVEDADGRHIGFLYSQGNSGSAVDCGTWSASILAGDALPSRLTYHTTEIGGTPVLAFETRDRSALFSGDAADFAITLRSTYTPKACATCPASGDQVPVAGSSTVLHRSDIFCLEPVFGDSDCEAIDKPLLYWWGRRTSDPRDPKGDFLHLGIEAFGDIVLHHFAETREYADFEIWLDLFKWAPEVDGASSVKERESAACLLRLFDLPGKGAMPSFAPLPPLAEEIAFPAMVDECYYQEPFNPFFNRDLVRKSEYDHKGTDNHGLPNTFQDAIEGWSCACRDQACTGVDCSEKSQGYSHLLPRLQFVANNDFSAYLPLEAYCNAHPAVCRDLASPVNAAAFNKHFGLPPQSTLGAELIMPRLRNDGPNGVPWGGQDGSGDRGVWTKARFKAGFDSRIVVIVRNEGVSSYTDANGRDYDTVLCDPASSGATGRYIYFDKDGNEHRSEPHPFECLPCNYNADDANLPPAYRGVHAEYCPSHYGIEQNEGIRIKTTRRILMPVDARGPALFELTANLVAKDEGGGRSPFKVVRRFPIYVDGAHQDFVRVSDEGVMTPGVRAREACWIGATGWVRNTDKKMVKMKVLPSALDHYLDHYLDEDLNANGMQPAERDLRRQHYRAVDNWLLGGDVNRWFKRKVGGKGRLVTLAGDVQTRWGALPWFDYRGSSVHFEQYVDPSDRPTWVQAEDGVAAGTACPVLRPLLLDDGTPLEMIRSTGQNRENGVSRLERSETGSSIHVDHCQETDKETVAPVSGFQFKDQEERGDAYIWFYVGRDWGWVSPFAKAQGGAELNKRYDLMTMMSLGVGRYDYDTQLAPWGSFIAHWDPKNGVDDLARSVSWECLADKDGDGRCGTSDIGTTFLNTAPLVVQDLGAFVEAPTSSFVDGPVSFDPARLVGREGLIVWHSGSYRTSPLYLSFATREDVLHPEKYWHFAGWHVRSDGSILGPSWSRLETKAVPVVWDMFGEFTVLSLEERNASPSCEKRTVFKDYVLIYPAVGHDGIILREASKPYGPFSDIVPLYGDVGNLTGFGDKLLEESGTRPLTAYSGYTHVDLWGDSVCEAGVPTSTKVRFNASIWTPYKTLLVEADVTRHRP